MRTTAAGLGQAKVALSRVLGIDAGIIRAQAGTPQSAEADVTLTWDGGTSEVDSATGIVYGVSLSKAPSGGSGQLLMVERLRYEAVGVLSQLGWTEGALAGFGFKEDGTGSLAEGSALYTSSWNRYDGKGVEQVGSIVLTLDARTAALVSFSASLGSDAANLAASVTEASALAIAQTEIYLRTTQPKLSLTGDGSLILLGRTMSEQLIVVKDSKITKTPTLCWVIVIRGSVGQETVGATVYIDANTGKVVKYVADKTTESTTTTEGE